MKYEKKQLENHQVELIVETNQEEFNKSKIKAARSISKESKIAGFRPGKAPFDVVKRLYGEDYIEERALDTILNEIYPDLLKQAKLRPYAPGKLDEIIEKKPPKFRLTIPLEPTVELPDYKSIRSSYNLPKISQDEIDSVLSNLQTNHATAEEVDRKAENGDLVTAKINAVLTKPQKDQNPQILQNTPHQVILGENIDAEQFPFKGFSNNLLGLGKNEQKEFTFKYSKDSQYDHLKNEEVKFSIQIESIKKLTKPEINDDFAKTLGVEDLNSLKETIQLQLENEKRNEYDNQYYNDLLDKIAQKAKIHYPLQALEDEIQDVLKNIEQNLAEQNLDLNTYLKINNRKKEDFIEKEVKPAAQKRLEHALILDEISRTEKIKLDQEDLQKEYVKTMQQIQSASDFQKLQKQFTTQKLSNAMVMQAASRLMNQRTLEKLKAYANGESQQIIDDSSDKSESKTESLKKEQK